MKKIISVLATIMLLCTSMTCIDVKAAEVSASLSGPASAKAGEEITLSLNIDATECTGANGQISFDTSKATMKSAATALSNWSYDLNAESGKFIVNDNNVVGVSGLQTIITFKIALASNLADNETITFNLANCLISYEGLNFTEGAVSASHTITISKTEANSPSGDDSSSTIPSDGESSSEDSSDESSTGATSNIVVTGGSASGSTFSSSPEDNADDKSDVSGSETLGTTDKDTTNVDTPNEGTTSKDDTSEDTSKDTIAIDKEAEQNSDDANQMNSSLFVWIGVAVAIVVVLGGILFFLLSKKKKQQED